MDASTETKSRKKSSDRKLEILRTLVRMMTESENKHITTKSLAAAIGVSEAALYRHFPSKTKMYEEIIGFALPVGNSPYYERGQERKPLVYMDGQATFKFAVNAIVRDCNTLVQRNGLTYADIAYIVPHQANMRIIDFAGRKLKVPMEKFCVNIDRYGNTSSASIPIALDELNRAGKLKQGDYLLLPAFGGGLASAACLLKW